MKYAPRWQQNPDWNGLIHLAAAKSRVKKLRQWGDPTVNIRAFLWKTCYYAAETDPS
jgi:hypothetical protein